MSTALIIQLLAQFGPPAIALITALFNTQTAGQVSAAEWATLMASLNQSSQDRMRAQLVAANIPLDSPQAVALLALAK